MGEHQYDVEEFESMIGQLDRRRFWRLACSGRYVEDVLIKAARECKVQQLGLYCQKSEPLKANQPESFWRYDVFGMINSLLRDVPDLAVVHGEVTSDDTAIRRNRDRTLPTDGALERRKIGYRYRCDGIVQVQGHHPVDIGVLEAAKVFDNTRSKFLMDTRKVTRELHDMLRNRLQALLVQTKARELLLVGYVVSGPTLMTLFASCPGGYIARIRPHHTEFKLADSVCHFNLNLRVLKHLLVTKLILSNSKAIIQEAPTIWDDDSEASTTDNSSSSEAAQEVQLPPLQSTPV
ncbi:hypothetical protein DFQ26_003154 [Actinomortierella ambigua]|nr:hypothetical protein DFQ26_003154 [Actinomortierella ambigua]